MNRSNRFIATTAKIVTKIAEVFHWVGVALMLAATVCSLAAPSFINLFVGYEAKECCGAELAVYGFEINAPVTNGQADMTAVFLFGISAVLILSLMAMIYRNLNLIIKRSEGATPFQSDNVRMLREIGIFAISVPIVGFIMSIVSRIVLGVEVAAISNNYSGLVIGLVVLCITQFFAQGLELENDVDGLL